MKKFYVLRHKDIHNNSGVGVVAEGIIFDVGGGAFTWLTEHRTVTVFDKITTIKKLHSHEGLTEIVIEGQRGKKELFDQCREMAHVRKMKLKDQRQKR